MKSKHRIKYFLALLILLSGIAKSTLAQHTFKYKADIETPKLSGFYKISLQPNLLAQCKADLADLRIIDQQESFVPYVKLESLPSIKENFINFPILQNTQDKDSITTLVVENAKPLLIRSLWLRLKNTAVSRSADLQGSDDNLNWFAIKEDIFLQQSVDHATNNYFQSLTFPASNYRYFKLIIHNKKKGPVQILQAGIYSNTRSAQTFIPLPVRVLQKDSSDRITYINLTFSRKYQVNKISFRVNRPKHFQRNVQVYSLSGKGKTLLTEASLSSGSQQQLVFSSKSPQLQIQIINGDNQPLQIDNLQAWQLNQFLIAYLESGKTYQLLFGDKQATEPDYDLKFFTDSALNYVSEIKHTALESNSLFKAPEIKKERDYTVVLWVIILAALALLIFLSWKMMAEMKRRD